MQKLVATADPNETYTTFTGVTRLKQGITPTGTFVPDNEDKSSESSTPLTRSVTVPAPSTSPGSDHPFWNVISRLMDSQRGSDQSCPFKEVKDHHQRLSQS